MPVPGVKHTLYGEKITITEACKQRGLVPSTIRSRIGKMGMTLQEAIEHVPDNTNKGNEEWQKLSKGRKAED